MPYLLLNLDVVACCSYQSPGHPDFADWLRFSDEVESIFTTKELEKAPLLEVSQFRPQEEWTTNALNEELDPLFINCMNRIADKVRACRRELVSVTGACCRRELMSAIGTCCCGQLVSVTGACCCRQHASISDSLSCGSLSHVMYAYA